MVALKQASLIRYKANLQRVGTVIPETIVVLREFARNPDWEAVKDVILKKNLLKKRSAHTVGPILNAMRQRYLQSDSQLPDAKSIGKFVSNEVPAMAKSQVLLPYICKADKLVSELIARLVKPMLTEASSKLSQDDVVTFLAKEGEMYPELKRWSDYLQRRWSRGFLALLRDFGFMEPSPSTKLTRPQVRVETFFFFLLSFLEKVSVPTLALSDPIWNFYLLRDKEKEELIREAQSRGWVRLLKAGDITEFSARYNSLEEWLDDLGQ